MPLVSIVIPCYNHGAYIDECIQSIELIQEKHLFEVIIVNDGSTDEFTNKKLAELPKRYLVINQNNQGLAAARNNGIERSKGKYILPVDADNKIRPAYIYTGIEIMEGNHEIDIVYGNAMLFGEGTGIRRPYTFNLQRLMLGNEIDACALYRKEVWENNGGYDQNMRNFQGYEDWEFWIHAYSNGFKFLHIDETLYDYRILGNSMIRQLNAQKKKNDEVIDYIAQKHPQLFGPQYIDENIIGKLRKNPIGYGGKLILKAFFPNRFMRLVEKGKLRKYI